MEIVWRGKGGGGVVLAPDRPWPVSWDTVPGQSGANGESQRRRPNAPPHAGRSGRYAGRARARETHDRNPLSQTHSLCRCMESQPKETAARPLNLSFVVVPRIRACPGGGEKGVKNTQSQAPMIFEPWKIRGPSRSELPLKGG